MRSGQPFPGNRPSQIARRFGAALLISTIAAAAATCGGSTAVETIVGPDAVRCQTTVSGQPSMLPPSGGSVNVTVSASRDCTWTATTESSWMQLNSTSGQGDATLAVTVARNDLPSARSGAVAVNDQRFTISQEPRPCTYELRASSQAIGAGGGRSSVAVETLTGCTWTANSSASWLRVLTPSGSGAGTVELEAEPNSAGVRDASVAVGGERLTFTQSDARQQGPPPPNCAVTFNPAAISAVAAGGTHTLAIGVGPACDWVATSSAPWLTITSPASGRGSAALALSVARNTGNARSATIAIGTQTAAVNQAAAPACTVTIDPPSLSFAPAGGEGRVRVTTQDGCAWSTSGGADWIQVANGSGAGGGEALYIVSVNTSTSARSATLTIGGRSHSVSQQADAAPPTCTYSLDPQLRNFAGAGGEGTVTVNTQGGCQWAASGAPPWVTVNGEQRSGSGQFTYNVQPNGTPSARSGGISVAGQVHGITQDALAPTCTYSLQPGAQNFGAGGGEGRFTVVTQAGCTWSASSGASWATVGTPGGTGQSDVVYTVQANSAPSTRSTGITVNGQVHTATQDAAAQTCTYGVQPASANFVAAGGDGRFDVITQAGCTWTASSGAAWATVGTGSGSGQGQVTYNVQPNTVSSTRSTTIVVNGQWHTVTQDAVAPACTYNVNPGSQNFPATGGNGSFTLATQAGCTWNASSGASWAMVTTPSGSGQANITYAVQANTTTAPRQTSITVNGQSHSVNQEAAPQPPPCSYSIDTASSQIGPTGGEGVVRVTTGPACAWTASSPVTWISLASSGGTGSGELRYTVAPNAGGVPREATITVAGQSHRVQQQ